MRFWDCSALLPLLVDEPTGARLRRTLAEDPQMLAWWSGRVEMASALGRRQRDGLLSAAEADAAFAGVNRLAQSWEEVAPTDLVRSTAQRLLRRHPLRAPDSLQLAAAVVAAGGGRLIRSGCSGLCGRRQRVHLPRYRPVGAPGRAARA